MAAGQHLAGVLTHLGFDQSVQLLVHRHNEISVGLPLDCQVGYLARIGLGVEDLHIVVGEQLLQ